MGGHTGVFDAPIRTVGILDLYMNRVLRAIKRPNKEMLIMAMLKKNARY